MQEASGRERNERVERAFDFRQGEKRAREREACTRRCTREKSKESHVGPIERKSERGREHAHTSIGALWILDLGRLNGYSSKQ